MSSGPTRGAAEPTHVWRASPRLAFLLRVVVFTVPVFAAYLAIRASDGWFFRPVGGWGVAFWILQAAIVGAVVSKGIGRLTRRLLPLATLLRTTLVFPDRAPSRFGVALRAGTVKQMRRRAQELNRNGLGSTAAEAAENAIVLVTGLARHDRLTRGHTERVRAYADVIAEEMGLSETDRHWLAWGVLLHDIGKVTVPAAVLNKVERLTNDEWEILKNHPAAGAEMLRPLTPWLGEWTRAAGEHHERWDGGGYPAGLASTEISLAGRIAAVADAYDVITSKRSYKEPMSAEAARKELVACAGTQFDPAVVRAFLSASIGKSPALGSLAWITEVPVVRGAVAVATSPIAAAVGTAVITTSALIGVGDDASSRRVAFASELESLTNAPIPAVTPIEEPTATTAPVVAPLPSSGDVTAPTTDAPTGTSPAEPTTTTASGEAPVPSTVAAPSTTSVPPSTDDGLTGDDPVPATVPPNTTLPGEPVSDAVVPGTTLPGVVVPSVTLPGVTVPSLTVPSITVPSVTIPAISTPLITTPVITTPAISTPVITTPALDLLDTETPEVTTPTIPIVDDLLGGLFG